MNVLLNDKIHTIGGEDLVSGKTFGQYDIYDLNKKEWHLGMDLKIPRHGHVSERFQSKWFIFGGGKKLE